MVVAINKRVNRWDYILNKCKGKKVLNIGCLAADKKSDLHSQIESVALNLYGLDIYESQLVNYIKGDAQKFSFPGEFDVIVVGEVIEHLADISGLLKSSHVSLKKDGLLIITTPNAYSAVSLRTAVRGRVVLNDKYHVLMFDVTTLSNMIENYAGEIFSGVVFYYYESNANSILYKAANWISAVRPGYSPGIVAELKKLD